MAFGGEAYVRVARQNSYNVAVTAAGSFHAVPFVSENLAVQVPELISDTIRARFEEGPSARGIMSAQGDIVIRPSPDQMGIFAYAISGVISSTQINSTYRHVFVPTQTRFGPDIAVTPWTIGRFAGVTREDQFTDCQLNRLQVEIVAGQYLRATGNWMARVHSGQANVSPTFVEAAEYTWNQASLSLNNAALIDWEQVTITIDNQLTMNPTLDGTLLNRRILRDGYRLIRVSAIADLPDLDEFDTFRAGSVQPLDITVEGTSISSGNVETLRFIIPSFRYSAFPVAVSGPGRVTVNLEGRAIYNQGSALAIQITVQNTRTNY